MRTLLSLLVIVAFVLTGCKNSPQIATGNNDANNNFINGNKSGENTFSNFASKAAELETSKADTYRIGQKEAQEDVLNKKFFIKTSGDPLKVVFEWEKLLKEKYGIQMFHFGCCYSDKVTEYVKGYNKVSESEIKKRFGKYVLDDTRKEAENNINSK